MELKRQELEAQKELYGSHIKLYDAQAAEQQAKAEQEKAVLEGARQFGQAGRVTAAAELPEWDMAPTRENAAIQRQDMGGLDQEAALNTVMALLGNPQRAADWKTKNSMNRSLSMTPELARSKFLGEKSMTVPHQGGVYDPVSQLITAIMPQTVGTGTSVVQPSPSGGSAPTIATGPTKPMLPTRQGSGTGPAINFMSKLGSGGIERGNEQFGPEFIKAIMNMATNMSPSTVTSSPQQRQLGERKTTPKGTFEWSFENGQYGWKQIQ
jgi:hypothetical protein